MPILPISWCAVASTCLPIFVKMGVNMNASLVPGPKRKRRKGPVPVVCRYS